ncbi:uncharacterized protein P884DRAFT_267444 [Thermothelomyces heterothallicus CBS 202.75]|uniref:uncharacterized protein n=1 Tax=Thermothelomyces heterothallicus CBS 202.75 TaxID=1149848 RepID=UPI003743E3C7
MAPRSSGTSPSPPPSHSANRESFLERKKKEIVDKSMAFLQSSLDRCLDKSVSSAPAIAGAVAGAGAAVEGARRRVKRVREDDGDESGGRGGRGDVSGSGSGEKAKKKKVNPKEEGGKKFACPFSKHDPARYQFTKTCCGPGWDDVHRVKEHVYRRHSLKNFCPRCFDHFDKSELLQQHVRAQVPCKLREKSFHAITEEQEKQLRTRAKPNCSEEDKWGEMYRTIFPDDKKIPSPYYDSDANGSSRSARSQFASFEEAREFLRVEIPRLVRPEIEKYVSTLFEEVQEKVNQKMVEIIRNVETKVLRTFHFQEEQASALPAATAAAVLGAGTGTDACVGAGTGAAAPAAPGEPSPPPSPGFGGDVAAVGNAAGAAGPGLSKIGQFFEDFQDDDFVNELVSSMRVDLESVLANSHGLLGCDVFSQGDSAYYTGSTSGEQSLYAAMGGGNGAYMHQC